VPAQPSAFAAIHCGSLQAAPLVQGFSAAGGAERDSAAPLRCRRRRRLWHTLSESNGENIWRQSREIFLLDGFQDGESDPRFLSHLLQADVLFDSNG